jgi:6-pyruvoyltetrahydropterin/6-carboxytetrahydropterin synthase
VVRLGRLVRFSVDPFRDDDGRGFNSYASKPPGEGLSLFLELAVELVGPAAPDTGLLVNVSDIDRAVRRFAVPVFVEQIRAYSRRGASIDLPVVAQMLRSAGARLSGKLDAARLDRLTLQLNPFRKLAMNTEKPDRIYFSEKFEFAAAHKLWNDRFSERQNVAVFGKCANPSGHGHNYLVEVTVEGPAEGPALSIGEFERVVDTHLMQLVDHKNLNLDVPAFGQKTPTVEHIACFAWERLAGQFGAARLHCVTVWESDRTWCSYYGGPEQP